MAKDLNYSSLLDYYGTMLTKKQFEVLDFYYNQDLSLAEISEIIGISRQGVMDIIRRGEVQLNHLESGLSLSIHYEKLASAITDLEKIIDLTGDITLKEELINILNKLQ